MRRVRRRGQGKPDPESRDHPPPGLARTPISDTPALSQETWRAVRTSPSLEPRLGAAPQTPRRTRPGPALESPVGAVPPRTALPDRPTGRRERGASTCSPCKPSTPTGPATAPTSTRILKVWPSAATRAGGSGGRQEGVSLAARPTITSLALSPALHRHRLGPRDEEALLRRGGS